LTNVSAALSPLRGGHAPSLLIRFAPAEAAPEQDDGSKIAERSPDEEGAVARVDDQQPTQRGGKRPGHLERRLIGAIGDAAILLLDLLHREDHQHAIRHIHQALAQGIEAGGHTQGAGEADRKQQGQAAQACPGDRIDASQAASQPGRTQGGQRSQPVRRAINQTKERGRGMQAAHKEKVEVRDNQARPQAGQRLHQNEHEERAVQQGAQACGTQPCECGSQPGAPGNSWPVLLGGAALTRAYVEQDLAELYEGEVRYARDAFEGLRLMDVVAAVKAGTPGAKLPELRKRRVAPASQLIVTEPGEMPERSDVATDNPVPTPPFWGTRVIKGIALADYASWLDERATFLGQWGLRGTRGGGAVHDGGTQAGGPRGQKTGPTYEELVETEGRPRLRMWLDRLHTGNLLEAAVVYGYFPAVSKGDSLIVLDENGNERTQFTLPRQRRDRHLCLADFFRPRDSGETDVVAFQLVTVGSRIAEETAKLFAGNAYRDYLELHGLSVQLTEALAEYWHARVRAELGFGAQDPATLDGMLKLEYRGARFSLGYGACPNLEDRAKIVELLEPGRIGVSLSEEYQLHPEQSTDAIVVHHPEAKYFNA